MFNVKKESLVAALVQATEQNRAVALMATGEGDVVVCASCMDRPELTKLCDCEEFDLGGIRASIADGFLEDSLEYFVPDDCCLT